MREYLILLVYTYLIVIGFFAFCGAVYYFSLWLKEQRTPPQERIFHDFGNGVRELKHGVWTPINEENE